MLNRLIASTLITSILLGTGCNITQGSEPQLPRDPNIAAYIAEQGGIYEYCMGVRDEIPKKGTVEALVETPMTFEAFGGIALFNDRLTNSEWLDLFRWTADNCYTYLPEPTQALSS